MTEVGRSGPAVRYGELVVLGYSSYKRQGAAATRGHWLPVGAPNTRFCLTRRSTPNALVPERVVFVESRLQKRELTHGLQQALATGKSTKFVCIPVSATTTVATELVESSMFDLFQLGRQPSPHNDFVVPGHLHGDKGTMSRFAARIMCDRAPPYTCRVFAGGFDTDHHVAVPMNAPKFCRSCQRWSSSSSTCKCIASTIVSNRVLGANHENTVTAFGFTNSIQPVDALTRNGVRLWRPETQSWVEVSVHGQIYAVSTASSSSSTAAFARPTGAPIAMEAVLTHGCILDLGGVHVKFIYPSSNNAPPGSLALRLESLRVHCPVHLHPLQFGPYPPIHSKRHHHEPSPQDGIPSAFQPHVYPACGHVCGYNARMASTQQCPLCRTPSTLVPLRVATRHGQRLLTSTLDHEQVPDCVFNPCGHMVDAALAAESAALRLATTGKSICPFCAKSLDPRRPYSKLFFYRDDYDDVETVGAAYRALSPLHTLGTQELNA
ncbi:hypothetical protein H310_07815 [Aphanomyces invadans]|uniref:Uncharacterized protein n=1 Tax=Aphanomyces invadans TaxID=157072 RepID=A0A024U0H0_9STRA|nr:hypothetical protein H310_07815 [Aphanomyces invadans]ETV99763.1 hypothetical protein H310_07815 [Aphanomyces invadans]|eukprot:XP_008871539.1 hypothetical protein H310_07815 [Aphanomyces invadans]